MKLFLLSFLIFFQSLFSSAQITAPPDPTMPPSDPGYADARTFADVLRTGGIDVLSISPSKLTGFFRGIPKAAFYRTDKGILEAIFFPDAEAAAKISVHETPKGERYIYSFTGQPHPRSPGDTMDSAKRMQFITYGNAFILIWGDDKLYETLRAFLK